MYSLYRAWLSMSPCGNVVPPSVLPTLSSGLPGNSSNMPLNLTTPAPLAGSPDVSLQVGPSLTNFSAHKTVLATHSGFFKAAIATHNGIGPIIVPNVNVDEFSSLLTFMYTGYLDLNLTNIYNILLATHILHMPRALEICRSFLMQSHPLEQRISNTNIIKPIASRKALLPHPQIFPPLFSNLEKSEETPFKAVAIETITEPHASTSKAGKPEVFNPDVAYKPETLKPELVQKPEKIKLKKPEGVLSDKVIIDIACCDGPVRFHRVINKNYGVANVENDYKPEGIENINRIDALNKVMNENIQNKQMIEDNLTSNEVFTCLYCNHTFKSQYCYQKHARRHLNPVSVENKNNPTEPSVAAKREVKLLDMNVQYYPCKTCGSKFPSYYFVHKHRKLCHAEEMADNNNKNNEIVKVKNDGMVENADDTQNSENSAKTSIIDVEETDNN